MKQGSEKQAKYIHELREWENLQSEETTTRKEEDRVRPLRLDRKWQLKSAFKDLVKKAEIPPTREGKETEDQKKRLVTVEDGTGCLYFSYSLYRSIENESNV